MNRPTALGRLENQSTMGVREYLTPTDAENLDCINQEYENLQAINFEFQNAIQGIQSARQNIDREISSFNVLDQFLYDEQGVEKVEQYSQQIDQLINTVDLNPVNSSMALGTKAILDAVKYAKDADPNFQIMNLENRIGVLESDILEKGAEKNTLEMKTAFSNVVVDLSKDVESKHITLLQGIDRYTREVKNRSGNVERTFQIINNINLPQVTNLVTPSNIEAEAGKNLFLFMSSCLRAQNVVDPPM